MDNFYTKICIKQKEEVRKNLHTYYFLFINTKSGNKQGLRYSQLASKKLKYIFENDNISNVQFFDLFDHKRAKLGIQYAKKLIETQNEQNQVRIIICGGDGTIPWVLNLGLQAKINFQKVIIGVMPIGTGNDFSRSIGWGYKSIHFSSKDLSSLHQIVKQWNKAQQGYYDIWDIQIQTLEEGGFYQIKDQIQIKKTQRVLKRCFTNYFGIGLDARIVYSVEKNRGANAFFNKVLYTLVGAKKLFQSLQNIPDTIQYVRETPQFFLPHEQSIGSSEQHMMTKQPGIDNEKEQLMNFQEKNYNQKQGINQFQLKKGYKGLVCLNCTSYMCGLRNVWMTNRSTNKKLDMLLNKSPQKYDDGKLQFIAFNNQLTLALERVFRTGVRIGQGSGPFQIKFKQKRQVTTTFMEIDGQSVKIQKISSIKVKKSQLYPKGRIRVLINNQH